MNQSIAHVSFLLECHKAARCTTHLDFVTPPVTVDALEIIIHYQALLCDISEIRTLLLLYTVYSQVEVSRLVRQCT
jgi:hypothetical protein